MIKESSLSPFKKSVSNKLMPAGSKVFTLLLNVVSILIIGIRTWLIRMLGVRAYFNGYNYPSYFPCTSTWWKAAICFEGFIHDETNNLLIPQLLFVLANINDIINCSLIFLISPVDIITILSMNQSLEWIYYSFLSFSLRSRIRMFCSLEFGRQIFWRFYIPIEHLHFNFRFSFVLEFI